MLTTRVAGLLAALCAAANVGPAVGQTSNHFTEIDIQGVLFRIPEERLKADMTKLKEGKASDRLYWLEKGRLKSDDISFAFWISDGKPLWSGYRQLPEAKKVGNGVFWPPEPGRPDRTGGDFLARVVDVYPRDAKQAMEAQTGLRGSGFGPNRTVTNYGRLQCGIAERVSAGQIICFNPVDDDPAVYMHGGAPNFMRDGGREPWRPMRLYFYSRADGLTGRIDFPDLGLPRWDEMMCKTLSFVRAWRVPPGPPPGDCTALPRPS
jgi:hypothetical protein